MRFISVQAGASVAAVTILITLVGSTRPASATTPHPRQSLASSVLSRYTSPSEHSLYDFPGGAEGRTQ